MNFLQRQFHHEIPRGDHELAHGETMSFLMVTTRYLMVSPWDHEILSWWGGEGGNFFCPPLPWDHELSHCHHEISHGLMVKPQNLFLPPPSPWEGVMVSWWCWVMEQAMMECFIIELYFQWLVFVDKQLSAFCCNFITHNRWQHMSLHTIVNWFALII